MRHLFLVLGLLGMFSLFGCGGGGGTGTTAPTLQSITVTPATPTVAGGATQKFTATGHYSNSSTQDLTNSATWASSDTAVATVSITGLVTAKTHGTAMISATSGGVSGSTTLTVPPVLLSLVVSTTTPSIAATTTASFIATGTYDDGSTKDITSSVSWTSSATSVATISDTVPTKGLAKGLTPGTSTMTATITIPSGTVSNTAMLTVTNATLQSIAVTPASPTIPLGVLQQFKAVGTFFDGVNTTTQDITNIVIWTSSAPNTASITVSGLATGLNLGTVTISAADGVINGTALLTVNAANLTSLAISPASPSMAQNTSLKLQSIGTFNDGSTRNLTSQSTWTSSNTAVATVGGATGIAKGLTAGTTTITAVFGSMNATATLTVTSTTIVSITVTPSGRTIAPGTKQNFSATGLFADNSSQVITSDVTWASSNTAVATISAAGSAQGVAAGTTNITASFGGVTGTAPLTVSGATLSSIAISPISAVLAPASTLVYQAVGTYSDGSTQTISNSVTWSSSATSVATIGAGSGQATGQSAGTATITAKLGAVSSTADLVVEASALQSISVSPSPTTLPAGFEQQFTATATFGDGSTQDLTNSVTWTSSPLSVATISNTTNLRGLASSVSAGTATITAKFGSVVGTASLTVNNAALNTITVTPASPSINLGSSQQFTATGNFTSPSSTLDLTEQANWTSSDVSVAVINSSGLANSAKVGTTTITATSGAVHGQTVLTVQ